VRSNQALFFTGERDKDKRGIEFVLAEHPRAFHGTRGSTAVVTDAPAQTIPQPSRADCATQPDFSGSTNRMAGHHDPAIGRPSISAGQNRQPHSAVRSPSKRDHLRNFVRVEANLEARAVAFELLEDPLPRGADPAVRLVGSDKVLRVSKLSSFTQNSRDPFLINLGHYLRDERVNTAGAVAAALPMEEPFAPEHQQQKSPHTKTNR